MGYASGFTDLCFSIIKTLRHILKILMFQIARHLRNFNCLDRFDSNSLGLGALYFLVSVLDLSLLCIFCYLLSYNGRIATGILLEVLGFRDQAPWT